MKKLLTLLAILSALVLALAACGGNSGNNKPNTGGEQNKPSAHTHSFTEWKLTVRPTCTENGKKERYCSCGEKQSASVLSLGHTEVVNRVVEPTCTKTGLTEGKSCSVCNKVIIAQTTVAAFGHTEVVDEAIEATCTTTGLTEGKHCSVCDEVILGRLTVDVLDHIEVVDEAVAATCSETGLTEGKHCSVCKTVIVEQIVTAKIAHGYTDKYDESCNECGFIRDAECAHINTNVIPAVAPTCVGTGLTEGKVCVKCEEITIAQEIAPALGHKEVIDAAVKPTYTETGLTAGKHCSVCGEITVKQEIIPVLEKPAYAYDSSAYIVASNYDLTAAEKELLKSGYLIGGTYDYQISSELYNCISVDIENKTITMESFVGSDGSVFNPIEVNILVNNSAVECIRNFTGNTVTYRTDSAEFEVRVKYTYENSIDEAEQSVLLNASTILKGGVDNLDAILDFDGTIQGALDKFASISMAVFPADELNPNPEEKPIFQLLLEDGYKANSPYGLVTVLFNEANGEKEPATRLLEQFVANGGKFNLTVIAEEYANATSKVQFLIENAERIMNEVADTRDCLRALNGEWGALNLFDTFAPDGIIRDVLNEQVSAMTTLAGDSSMTGILDAYTVADAWDILDTNPVRDDLTNSEYVLLDTLVAALGDDIKGASMEVKNPLIINKIELKYDASVNNAGGNATND